MSSFVYNQKLKNMGTNPPKEKRLTVIIAKDVIDLLERIAIAPPYNDINAKSKVVNCLIRGYYSRNKKWIERIIEPTEDVPE